MIKKASIKELNVQFGEVNVALKGAIQYRNELEEKIAQLKEDLNWAEQDVAMLRAHRSEIYYWMGAAIEE